MTYNASDLHKQISTTITSTLVDAIVDDLHSNAYRAITSQTNNDIYDELKGMGYNVDRKSVGRNIHNAEIEASTALKLFFKTILESYSKEQNIKIKEHLEHQIRELKLKSTSNPNLMESSDGKFYALENYNYVEQKNVFMVCPDGCYYSKEQIKNSKSDFLIVKYNISNKAVSLKMVNRHNITNKNRDEIANKLKLKKEYVKRFKLPGYSGNTSGSLIKDIANLLFAPIASGYFIDEKYNIFKWNEKTVQFEKELRTGICPGAPLLSDYEVKDKIVIRTDYDGKGLR